ncbi:MAG: hypothetical protein SFU91_12545 [Chloroherpetonaceae bacterium]|nr:hypothetical protein [Chloroherpetonaceae bacterium]
MKETQVYLRTEQRWKGLQFQAETRYQPSMYIAKVEFEVESGMNEDDKEAFASTILRLLEEKMKLEFKRQLETTEEKHGFLETSSLTRLSERLARECQRISQKYRVTQFNCSID